MKFFESSQDYRRNNIYIKSNKIKRWKCFIIVRWKDAEPWSLNGAIKSVLYTSSM